VARMGGRTDLYWSLVGRSDGWRKLGRPGRRSENNIKIELREMGFEAWTGLIWLRIGTGDGHL
jgi:hypothetical protein